MAGRVGPERGWRLALAGALFLAAGVVRAESWRWNLSNERYQKLNVFERAQYDKAAGLLKDGSYRAAASEFEKFKVQFPDSENLSNILFMIGYASHLDKQRHKAIKIYNEVLDYFGDEVEDAAAALYHIGIACIDNGDVREGMQYLKEMVEDEDYRQQPLAAGALRRLADNEWNNGNPEGAVRYWKQVVSDFAGANPDEARIARDQVTAYYIQNGNYRDYEAWAIDGERREDPAHRKAVAQDAWRVAFEGFRTGWAKYTDFNRAEKVKDMEAFHAYFGGQQAWYEKTEDAWTFYNNALLFASHRMQNRPETKRLLEKAIPLVQALTDEKARNDRYAWMSDRLREGGDFDQALHCLTYLKDPPQAAYKEYEVMAASGKWAEGVKRLEAVEAMNHAQWSPRALKERARVCKDVLHDYEKAVALYQQINQPPSSLWAIQDSYRSWGKLAEALGILAEIEGSFPDDAANAAWHKAKYLDESGQTKESIAAARRVLKVYPQSRSSSLAHQLLEKYGVDTGGATTEEE